MCGIVRWLRDLCHARRAATAVEYGLMLGLIAVAIMASVDGVGDITAELWGDVATKVIRNGPQG